MSEAYHPEVDDLPLSTEDYSAKYRSIIGCCIWTIVLVEFDIAYTTYALSMFNMLPREEHLKAVKRILSYLKTFPNVRVIIDTSYPEHSVPIVYHSNRVQFYPDTLEEILKYLSPDKKPRIRMTAFVDADHAHDLVTRRSIIGIFVIINNTPVRWISKHQKRHWRHQLMAQNWCHQGLVQNILEDRCMFGHELWHWMGPH
jgi:hypothetical protein